MDVEDPVEDPVGETAAVILTDFITEPRVAETIVHPDMVGDVVKGNVALKEPAAMLTEAGSVRAALVDFTVTTVATVLVEVKMMMHAPPRPGVTVVGEQVSVSGDDTGAVMVRVAVLLAPLRMAVTVGV